MNTPRRGYGFYLGLEMVAIAGSSLAVGLLFGKGVFTLYLALQLFRLKADFRKDAPLRRRAAFRWIHGGKV